MKKHLDLCQEKEVKKSKEFSQPKSKKNFQMSDVDLSREIILRKKDSGKYFVGKPLAVVGGTDDSDEDFYVTSVRDEKSRVSSSGRTKMHRPARRGEHADGDYDDQGKTGSYSSSSYSHRDANTAYRRGTARREQEAVASKERSLPYTEIRISDGYDYLRTDTLVQLIGQAEYLLFSNRKRVDSGTAAVVDDVILKLDAFKKLINHKDLGDSMEAIMDSSKTAAMKIKGEFRRDRSIADR